MENTDFHTTTHTTTHTPEPAPKKPRGRPAKYAKEEREQKYKESKNEWTKTNINRRYELNEQYSQRVRLGYKLLCDIWNKHYLDNVEDPLCAQIKELVENKKIIAL
jgi:hypothetical protein